MSNLDEQDEYSIVIDQIEANPKYFSNIMSKHIGHEHIGIFALTHIHRIRDIANHIQIRVKQFQSSVEEVHLELLSLFSMGLSR